MMKQSAAILPAHGPVCAGALYQLALYDPLDESAPLRPVGGPAELPAIRAALRRYRDSVDGDEHVTLALGAFADE